MSLFRRLMNRNMTLYAQLDALAECGIAPREGVGPAELLARHSDREYETSPFKLVLAELGSDSSGPPYLPLSDNVWHMRAECAARGGDYVRIAHRMAKLAGNLLPIDSVHDEFDLRRGVAWLTFNLRSREFRWPAKIEERWIDPMILSRFAGLLETQDTEHRYICLDLGGQDCLLGCATEEQFAALRKRTGLAFEWLG
ncbi:MAG TPA: hypothetical protein VMU45_07620 [Candidatus Eisenbacteria bacterium]|nr:hypothetical protein [Candidatus Eisenbacteria bacterium]